MNVVSDFTIVNVLLLVATVALTVQAFIGLSFFISSLWEKERRAANYAAMQDDLVPIPGGGMPLSGRLGWL